MGTNAVDSFWSKAKPNAGGCWLWSGHVMRSGYGQAYNPAVGRMTGAHRVAYMLAKGPLADGLDVRHKCGIRPCINPAHLEAVTRAQAMRLNQNPTSIREHAIARFWSRVQKTTASGCWEWMGTFKEGYGRLWYLGRHVYAHRLSYELCAGPVSEGLQLDHLCRNRKCVNPAHLEPVTARVNIMRGEGVAPTHAAKTHCPKGHPLSGDNLVRSAPSRACLICRRHVAVAYAHRRRAARRIEVDV